jgi:putative phage-type endonuclease
VAPPLTPAWYKARKTGVGSSEAAEAVGRSQWRTPLDLYLVKTGAVPEFQGNTSTRIGQALEPLIRSLFEEQMQRRAWTGQPPMLRSKAHPYMLATCDSFLDGDEILECKWTRYGEAWGEQGTDAIPEEVILQAQQQMIVTGGRRVWVAVLVEAAFKVYFVDREGDLIEWMIGEERVFWNKVLDKEPPPVNPDHKAALGAVRALYGGQIEPVAVHLSAEGDKARERLNGIRETITALEREADGLKARLLGEIGSAEFGIGADGSGLKREFRKACEYTVKRDESVILKRVEKLPKRLLLKEN